MVRYRNGVLKCYSLVMHCCSGIFLTSLPIACGLFDRMSEPYFPGEGFQADTLKRNMKHM
jgi:hypothetical protein